MTAVEGCAKESNLGRKELGMLSLHSMKLACFSMLENLPYSENEFVLFSMLITNNLGGLLACCVCSIN
jgi:hypothetical protein